MENKILTSKEAVNYVMDYYGYETINSLSKALYEKNFKIQPIMLKSYKDGKRRMSEKTASMFEEMFNVEIIDAHRAKGRPPVM